MIAAENKYTRIEYERRFIVAPNADWQRDIAPYAKTLDDKYLHDSRLRLRVMTDCDSGRRVIKLSKKEASDSPYCCTISRILLSPRELELFDALPGNRLRKTRHYHEYQGRVFALDVFADELTGLVLCEIEANNLDELLAIQPPPYAQREVTEDSFFTSGNLCRLSRAELQQKLALMN